MVSLVFVPPIANQQLLVQAVHFLPCHFLTLMDFSLVASHICGHGCRQSLAMLGGRGVTRVRFHGWLDQHESSCPCGDRSDGTAQGHAILFPESPGLDTLGQPAWMLTF